MLTGGMLDPVAELDSLIAGLDRDIREPTRLRAVLVPELRRVIEAGHRQAEEQLLRDRNGMECAQSLSRLTDAVVAGDPRRRGLAPLSQRQSDDG